MSIEINNKFGTIKVSPEIIAEIAEKAASECYGVVGLNWPPKKGMASILKRDSSKGVVIRDEQDGIVVSLYLIIQYGVNISVVAENIMDNVKYHLETQLGVQVKQVHITIDEVRQGV